MSVLVIGATGQLGSDISRIWGGGAIPLSHGDMEIADYSRSKAVVAKHRATVVINTAAYHNVVQCEKKPETAFSVNSIGVKNLAQICKTHGLTLVQVSTDYVYDGRSTTPYTEQDTPNPLNVYGISKLAGEAFARRVEKHYIVRVASLFGVRGCKAKGGHNFVKTMLALASRKDTIEVTSNVISSPTYTVDAASRIKQLIEESYPPGIYHVTNSGCCSWFEFAVEIFKQRGIPVTVEERIENEETEGVMRPLYSALVSTKLEPLRHWKDALRAYLEEEPDGVAENQHSRDISAPVGEVRNGGTRSAHQGRRSQ